MTTEEQQSCLEGEGDDDKTTTDTINESNGGDVGGDDDKKNNGVDSQKTNGDLNKEYIHSNGVRNGGGDDGVPKKNTAMKQNMDDDTPMSPEEMEKYIPEPPDGGWGWVIVGASMVNNLIVDGIGYTFGVFLSEFVDAFKEPKSKVSMVGSLLCGVYLFAGPVVSAMTNKFGCRKVVICGSLVATVAFLLAMHAPNIDLLIMTYGVMGGFGLGMMYLPSIVSVGYYFQARRAFATGLAVAGSGLGTFIFPPLSEYLLNQYAWRNALLLIAGVIFNGCVTGALMRPLEVNPNKKAKNNNNNNKPKKKRMWHRAQQYFRRDRAQSESVTFQGDDIAAGVREAKLRREKKLQETDSIIGSISSVTFKRLDSTGTADSRGRHQKTSISSNAPDSPGTSAEGSQPPTPKIIIELEDEDGSKVTEDIIILDGPRESKDLKDGVTSNKPVSKNSSHASGRGSELSPLLVVPGAAGASGGAGGGVLPAGYGGSRSNLYHLSSVRSLHVSKKDLAKDLARPMYRKDIFYSASVLNIPQYNQSQQDVKNYIASITTLPGERDYLDGTTASAKCINSCCSCLPRSARDILSEMVDISLFKDISFMLICLGNFFAFLGFFVPFVFMVDKAVDVGIAKSDAALLISIIGITNTVGRVVIGKLVDLKILDSLVVSYASIALCGVVTALTPFCNVYALLAINAALFGTGMAAFISLSSIIICDRMGVEKLTNAFGLMSMTRGLAGMMGPPLAGRLFDLTDSYNMSFWAAGFFLLLGALCHVFLHLPCIKSRAPGPPVEVTMEEIDPSEIALITGGKEQPQVIRVEDISNELER